MAKPLEVEVVETGHSKRLFSLIVDGDTLFASLSFDAVSLIVNGIIRDFKTDAVWQNNPKVLAVTYKFI